MKKCKRNIFLIFGYLLIMAGLFLPYDWKEFEFLPIIIAKGYLDIIEVEVLITEIAVILALGGFAYIIFCVVLKKEKGGEK